MFYTTEQLATKEQLAEACHTEAELVRYYGNHTLAFFGLAPENLHFLAPGGEGLVNYRLTSNVAVVLGDPVCAPEACEHVTRSFLEFCALQNWRVAFYQAYPERLDTYRALKLHAFKIGEEAIIHPQTFTLSGSAMANIRTSCRRAEREGVTIHWYEGVPPAEVMHQLEQLSSTWLEHKGGKDASEMGFSMGRLDELSDTAERADAVANISTPSNVSHRVFPQLVTGVATTSSGKACAFVTFTPIYGFSTNEATATGNQFGTQGWGWTLDLMRRTPDAPPGVIELLLVRAIERFRSCGAQIVSLGMVAWADTRQEMTSGQRQLASFVTDRLRLLEPRRTLFNFKQKFHPRWESRYVVAGKTLALPKIALAVLRLRNYSGGGLSIVHRFHAWSSTFRQFLRYCLVGGANTVIDLLALNALLWRFPTNNVLALVLYNSVAYTGGALSSFFLNKYWTFGHKRRTTWREVIRFAISLSFEVLYSNGLVWLAGKALQPLIANVTLWGNATKLIAVAGGAVISYTCMRFWTFAGGSQDRPKKQETNSQIAAGPATIPASGVAEHAHHHVESERIS